MFDETTLKTVLEYDAYNMELDEMMKVVKKLNEENAAIEKNKAFLEKEIEYISNKTKFLMEKLPEYTLKNTSSDSPKTQKFLLPNKVNQFQRNIEKEAIQNLDGYFQAMDKV